MNRRSLIAATILATLVACSASAQTPRALLPDVPGWKLTTEETVYKPDNLWDLIDGAADLYLEYNFIDLRLGRYQNSDDVEVKVELYRHASQADAFGIYSQERYPDYHFLDLGVQGYREKGVVNFLAGQYYVKISSIQAGDKVQEGLLAIAKLVELHLRQSKAFPALLAVFPEAGRQANTEQYIAKSFLGYSFLNGAYVVTYDNNGPFKSFVMDCESGVQVQKLVSTYVAGIPKKGVSSMASGWLKVDDPHNGTIELGWQDRYLFGAYAEEKASSRGIFLQELAGKLAAIR
ncbi:MAG TPA: hypothetical protein DEP53_01025 [Bacteroidetes bacterium]|nr:MAG: hypothetical protein A2X66_03220 [Ignavibacteria bacterium GWA2_54_16]HCA78294.1 hypothetical protein [Bacteroidota bacterium]